MGREVRGSTGQSWWALSGTRCYCTIPLPSYGFVPMKNPGKHISGVRWTVLVPAPQEAQRRAGERSRHLGRREKHLGSSLWRGGCEGPLHKLMDKSSLLLKGIDKDISIPNLARDSYGSSGETSPHQVSLTSTCTKRVHPFSRVFPPPTMIMPLARCSQSTMFLAYVFPTPSAGSIFIFERVC